MANYIRDLVYEYSGKLPTVADDCVIFERDMQNYLRGDSPNPPTAPTLDMEAFPKLEAFLDDTKFRQSEFRTGYLNARSWIENELSALRAVA